MSGETYAFCHIDRSARIAESVKMGFHAVIMADVSVRENSTIGNNVVVYPGTEIGENVTVYDNAVLGRRPQTTGNSTRPLKTDLSSLVIGEGSVIGACAVLYAGTRIGSRVLVSDLVSIREECVVEDLAVLGRGVILNYNVCVGKRTKIMDQSHITGNCVIGDDCFISVLVGTTNENSMGFAEEMEIVGPAIGDRVRIGVGAIILPGKKIGSDSTISAGSVVSINIPAGVLAGGHPARVIRDNPFLRRRC
jgi:UDP-3-O-[3-hydroxymyristoyl] glucosamine N-acyltransferase